MNSLINSTLEYTFCFDESAKFQNNYSPFDIRFYEQDHCINDLEEMKQKQIYDQDSAKNYKSTHENTLSDREFHHDELAPTVVPFINDEPHLGALEKIVFNQINEKGYNMVVMDCLDLTEEDEIEEENQDIIRKKQKKSRGQIRALKNEFRKRPNWTKRTMKKIAKELGLSQNQVYKWHWDQTNKQTKSSPAVSHKRVKTCE